MYQFKASQFLPIGIQEAWRFFSSPTNLPVITPPELDFKILTPLPSKKIYEGLLIDYTVKPLFGIPVHWQTLICDVETNSFFTDKQLKGPYKVWEHTHTFTEVEGGVLMHDVVNYQLPLGILGKLANALIVQKKISGIFEYRKSVLDKLFKTP